MKYAFIDRDGTLVFEPQDTFLVEKVIILPNVIESLKKIQKAGFSLVLITNQDGLGTDANPQSLFNQTQAELLSILEINGIQLNQILVCGHAATANCLCRKPKTGLVESYKIYPESIVIGDRESDVQFAKNLGIKSILVDTNKGFNYE